MLNASKAVAAIAGLVLGAVLPVQAQEVQPHQSIPGVSAEPLKEGAGLKTPQELETFLDGIMAAHLKAQRTPGATVSVVKDGQLFFAKGYGFADVEKQIPVDADQTLFRPGSVSKLFGWTALMQLVEQGKVSLDADVNTYLTQFKIPDTWPGKPVTVRNLFTHTEGFEDGSLGFLIVDSAERLDTLAGGLEHHMPARVHPPTTDFNTAENSSYSNWGAALAGLIIENVSGMPFDDYIEKNIFAPLGMQHSTFRQPVPAALLPHLSQGYDREAALLHAKGFEYVNIWPAGSLSATATDMAKFMIAHLNKGALGEARILKEETAKQMHGRAMSPGPYLNGSGLGFYENSLNGHRVISHAGDLQRFHSELNLLPDDNVGIFVSYNAQATLPFSMRGDLFAAFMNRYYPAKLPVLKGAESFKESAAKYAGSYRMNRMSHTRLEKLFSIMSAFKVTPTGNNTLMLTLGDAIAWEFVEVKPGVFRRVDADHFMAFSEDASGQVSYLLNPIAIPFIGAYKLKAYETPAVLGLIAGFGLLCFVVSLVSALRHWRADGLVPDAARRARRLAALNGVINIVFAAGLGISIAILTKNPESDFPAWFYASRVLPWIAAAITAWMGWLAVTAWRQKFWTAYGRFQYSLIVLGNVGFFWLLCYANLPGWGH